MPGKEPPQPAALPTPAAPTVTGESITIDAVKPVSLAEEMDDDIPF
jgi:hypothetical protein